MQPSTADSRTDGHHLPSAIVVLITGLPAAGKSSFLKVIGGSTALPDIQRHYEIHILQLDRILQSMMKEVYPRGTSGATFDPALWKKATRQLVDDVKSTLEAAVSQLQQERRVPIIFVEDNMHLRSMREQYYWLCRAVEKTISRTMGDANGSSTSREFFIGLLELRMTTPLAVCLDRNALRQEAQKEGVAASTGEEELFVSPHSLCSMATTFDHCIAAPSSSEESPPLPPKDQVWYDTSSTQPWTLLQSSPTAVEPMEVLPSAAELCDGFWWFLQNRYPAIWPAHRQLLLAKRERQAQRQREADKLQHSTASYDTLTHQLDLQLRRTVSQFFSRYGGDVGSQANAKFAKAIQQQKRTAVRELKERLEVEEKASRRMETAVNLEEIAAVLQVECVATFQERLMVEWSRIQAMSSPSKQ